MDTLTVLSKHATNGSTRCNLFDSYERLVTPRIVVIYAGWKIFKNQIKKARFIAGPKITLNLRVLFGAQLFQAFYGISIYPRRSKIPYQTNDHSPLP